MKMTRRNYWYLVHGDAGHYFLKVKLAPETFMTMLALAYEYPQVEVLRLKGLMYLFRRHYGAQAFSLSSKQWAAFQKRHPLLDIEPVFSTHAVPLLDDVSAIRIIHNDFELPKADVTDFGPWLRQCRRGIKKEMQMRAA